MYPQTVLDEIKDRVSIVALIGERVPLKKAGRNHKGACPFHSEKTPSFMVSDEKQIYHCFGCGEGGNVFNFFMKFDGVSFRETVEMLASRAGVKLPQLKPIDKKADDEISTKKKWAYHLNQIVAEYFHQNLKDERKGMLARNYLKSRDIFFEKNTQHFLGYADDNWDGLVRHLRDKKAPLDLAAEMGLLKRREDGGYYDFFRHRVMFPIMTPAPYRAEDIVAAFSGRTFGEPKTAEGREPPAKYINSPDSLVYHKSYTVYGLNIAAENIRRENEVILVEGNLDVVRLHQEGIKNAVAPLGTALTSGHLKLLFRYTKNFVVIFDGDDAGKAAAARSLPLFLEASIVPRVVSLAKGEDPDSFVRKNGAEALRGLIKNAGTLFEWVIDNAATKYGKTTDGKVKAVEELKPFFAEIRNPVESAIYKRHLALMLDLEESVIQASLRGQKLKGGEAQTVVKTGGIERTLLEVMLTYPETIAEASEIAAERFSDGSYQTIARLVFDEFKRNKKLDVGRLAEGIADSELKSEILSLAMAENKYEDAAEAIRACITGFERLSAKKRLAELSEKIKLADKNDAKITEYMIEMQKIRGKT